MANKNGNYYPVQTDLLMVDNAPGLGVTRIDRELSGLNRRLYRQNRVYRVKVDAIGRGDQSIDVYRLRDTFMLQRGYGEAMKAWTESYEAAEEVVKDSAKARWRDFRIDVRPHIADLLLNSVNLRATGTAVSTQTVQIDEYAASLAYQPDGSSRDFGIRSDSNTFDIITEYNKMGKVQSEPSVVTTEAAYEELNSDLNDNQVFDLQAAGNQPPYDADDMHALDVLEYVGTVFRNGDGNSKTTTGYFDAPLGVVITKTQGFAKIDSIDSGETNLIKMKVQRGDYKGVAAHEFVDVTKMG